MIPNPFQPPLGDENINHKKPFKLRDKLLMFIALLGLIHFTLSVFTWCSVGVLVIRGFSEIIWFEFMYSVPAFVLFILFATSVSLCYRQNNKSWIVLTVSILLSIGSFAFDATNHHWQFHWESKTDSACKYCTWWWYNDTWFD